MDNTTYPPDRFLENTKKSLDDKSYSQIHLIIGNETCDLDSAVSSIVLARLLHWEDCLENFCSKHVYVPLLDVNRKDYTLKTEVVYAFNSVGIKADSLFFRDDYDYKQLIKNSTRVYLVDHHILAKHYEYLKPFVSHIIDHRPRDPRINEYKSGVKLDMNIVGSCATLIAKRCQMSLFDNFMMQGYRKPFVFLEEHSQYAELLHSAIILDTVNFSKVVNKGTPLDKEMAIYLEKILKVRDRNSYRMNKLSKLTNAKSDVSNLTAAQLLKKDAKIKGPVFLPGFPISVEEFLLKPDAMKAISDALELNGCSLCILLGLKINNSQTERDIAVYNTKNDPIAKELSNHLKNWSSPNLQLEYVSKNDANIDYFKQINLSASRKQYMPAVEDFIKKINK